jgi:hypothetical protein
MFHIGAKRRHPRGPLLLALAVAGGAGCEPPRANPSNATILGSGAPGETTSCNPTNARILGDWARPEVHHVHARGDTSPAPDWSALLWLPYASYEDGCRFSCASTSLAAVVSAAGPATFVQLSHPTEGARRLGSSGATLSVAGAAAVAQTAMRTDRFEPYEANAYDQSYVFAFPPTNPPTWEFLEVTIPIEGSRDRLRVRFVRGNYDSTIGADPR